MHLAAVTAVIPPSDLVRLDTVGAVMLALVALVGWVVLRYSRAYLAGDPHQRRYVTRLLATLAAVTAVVVANNVVVLVLAWGITSLALHGLLTFFGDRPVAVAVAHKKFILARCADLCMVGATIGFATTFHTLRIDRITAAATAGDLPMGGHIAIALVALAAVLKTAQLPFHGWLIQVMEAPTPVSALLHAGVVNLGGFVLLRFAPVVDRATETRVLLVVVGAVTAVLAALVMSTRISIKVSLAWSTCAQMGFMLVQCGLGLWGMALLHLLAHSMYKAHAFLGAGGVVRHTQRAQLAPEPRHAGAATLVGAAVIGVGATIASAWLWGRLPFSHAPSATVMVMCGVVGLALVPLLTSGVRQGRTVPASLVAGTIGVPLAWFALHDLFAHVVPSGPAAPAGLLVAVAALFVSLFVVQTHCATHPSGRLARGLYPWVYGGLFIDEAFTRLAFRVWPPSAPRARVTPLPQPHATPQFATTAPDRSHA